MVIIINIIIHYVNIFNHKTMVYMYFLTSRESRKCTFQCMICNPIYIGHPNIYVHVWSNNEMYVSQSSIPYMIIIHTVHVSVKSTSYGLSSRGSRFQNIMRVQSPRLMYNQQNHNIRQAPNTIGGPTPSLVCEKLLTQRSYKGKLTSSILLKEGMT